MSTLRDAYDTLRLEAEQRDGSSYIIVDRWIH